MGEDALAANEIQDVLVYQRNMDELPAAIPQTQQDHVQEKFPKSEDPNQ